MSKNRKLRPIERLYSVIARSVFQINPPLNYDRTTIAITRLANLVRAYDGETDELWAIGECECCDLASFLVGAYWHYSECHSGQSSPGYAALSALGQVYTANMANGPEEDSSEFDAYDSLNHIAGLPTVHEYVD